MSNRAVCVLDSSGKKLGYTTKTDAEEKMAAGTATQESKRCIRMLASQIRLRGLSARVGETLTAALNRGEAWATTALEEIQR